MAERHAPVISAGKGDAYVPIGKKHKKHPTHAQYKHYWQEHHTPHGHVKHSDYCWNGLAWLLAFVFIGGFIALIVLGFTSSYPHSHYPPPPPPFKRESNETIRLRMAKRISPRRTTCTTGETFDRELAMCAPNFHSPLAFDGSIMDHTTPVCDSFYRAMCGTWDDQHTNENRGFSYGYYSNQAKIRKIISEETIFTNNVVLPTPSSSSLTDFYRSCLIVKTATGKKETELQLKHKIATIVGNMDSRGEVPAMFGRLARAGYTAPLAISIERHPVESRMVPLFTWDGMPSGMREQEMYLLYRNTNAVHGLSSIEVDHHIMSVLSILRHMHINNRRPMSSITSYPAYIQNDFPRDLMPFSNLPQKWNVKGHDKMNGWSEFFEALAGPTFRLTQDQDVWVIDSEYFDWLCNKGIAQFTVNDWKAFGLFSILYNGHNFVPDLPQDVYFKQHDHQGPLGPGGRLYHRIKRDNASSTADDEEQCVRITQHMLPGLLAEQFLKRSFQDKEAVKANVRQMVEKNQASYIEMINETPWLSVEDKNILVTKIENTIIRVAEPDQWQVEPFSQSISPFRFLHNLDLVREYRVRRNLALFHKKNELNAFDRSAIAFFAVPLTDVNAYYSGPTNTITVLAGILQHPFYSSSYNDVSKQAILGSILGHEMSHMADNHGLYWDKEGGFQVNGIISPRGMQTFYEKTACVVEEYGPAPLGCEDANAHYGNSTLGEDMADLMGISLSYRSFFDRLAPGVAARPLADKQHFFMVLGQAFCETYDQQHRCNAVANDEHVVADFRINRTFRNLKQFASIFGCNAEQGMYKAEGNVCRVYGSA